MRNFLMFFPLRTRQRAMLFSVFCSIFGALVGISVFNPLLGNSLAIGIIDLGKIEVGKTDVGTIESGRIEIGMTRPIEEIIALSTRMISKDFTSAVAHRLADPSAAQELLGSIYGGQGDLKVRSLRDWYRIEIKVRHKSEQIAINRLTAVMDEVLFQHDKNAIILLDHYYKEHKFEQALRAEAEKRFQEIVAELAKLASTTEGVDNIASKHELIEQLTLISQKISEKDQTANEPFYIKSSVIAGPSPYRPFLNSAMEMALLGAIGGFALGFIAIQVRRAIV